MLSWRRSVLGIARTQVTWSGANSAATITSAATRGKSQQLSALRPRTSAGSDREQHHLSLALAAASRYTQRTRSRFTAPLRPAPCMAAAAAGASTAAPPASAHEQAASAVSNAATSASDASQLTSQIADAAASSLPAVEPASPPSWLVQESMDALVWAHSTLGTPWWASIVLIGLASRALMVPVQIYSARVMSALSGLEPHFLQLDLLSRAATPDPWRRVFVVMKLQWALMSKYKCNPLRLVPGAVAQMGLFVLLATSLRRLITSHPELTTGGALWFPDLTAPDATMALPVIVWAAGYALSHITAMYYEKKSAKMRDEVRASVVMQRERAEVGGKAAALSGQTASAPTPVPGTSVHAVDAAVAHVKGFFAQFGYFVRGVQVLSILVLPYFPSGVLLLWSASIGWQAVWHAIIRQEGVRRYIGLTQRETAITGITMQMALERKAAQQAQAQGQGRAGVDSAPRTSHTLTQQRMAQGQHDTQAQATATGKGLRKRAATVTAQPTLAAAPVAPSIPAKPVRLATPLAASKTWASAAKQTAGKQQ